MCHNPQELPKQSCRAQFREEERKADKGRDGKTTFRSGQACHLPTPLDCLRIERDGGNWLSSLQWCPNGLDDFGIHDDDDDDEISSTIR